MRWKKRGNCTVVQSWTRQEFGLSFVFVSFPSSLKSLLSSSFPPSLTIPRPSAGPCPTNQPTPFSQASRGGDLIGCSLALSSLFFSLSIPSLFQLPSSGSSSSGDIFPNTACRLFASFHKIKKENLFFTSTLPSLR